MSASTASVPAAAVPAVPPVAVVPAVPSVAVVGAHGHGASHVRGAHDLAARGAIAFAAIADPRPLDEAGAGSGVPWFASVDALVAAHPAPLDAVVVCTPIPTHGPLAEQLMRAGSDVLLEKPPTATLAEFERLLEVQAETGRAVQVAFQSLGSAGIERVRELVAAGAIGELSHLGGVGTWVRDTGYWTRAAWAGKRMLGGTPVVDGVVTNPLAHAVATALRLAGATTVADVASVSVELFRANDIEADDTSSVMIDTAAGTRIALGLTLCASRTSEPSVTVYGSRGRIVFYYTLDVVQLFTAESAGDSAVDPLPVTSRHPRADLLENLLEHRATGAPLLDDLVDTGAFMRVLEAVRLADDPLAIAPELVEWRDDERGRHVVVRDVEAWVQRVADEGRGFAELGAPWAVSA